VADIAERARDPRLQALYDEGVNVYSFSKLGTINSCLYGAWRTYILHDRGSGSVYTELGTASHQAIEDFIEGKIDKSGMLPIFEAGVEQCDMLGFDFPKDFKGGNSIRTRYLTDLKNCFQTFTMPKGKFTVEELLILRVSPTRAMQGYSDLLRWNNDGTVTVLDIKSSSDYAQKDLLEHGRQLTIYGMALEQAGYKVKSTAWIMLKYVVIKYDWYATRRSKNKTSLTRIVNRSKIYDTIKDAVEAACHEAGMDEMDIEIAMMDFAKTNILGDLFPAEVKAKFSIKPYVREYPYTKELQAEALDYINKTADLYESLPQDKDHPWEPCEITKDCAFFCNTLCGHRKTCPYIKDYNERTMVGATQSKKDEEDLF
jgi:RecB family exonuclease